MGLTDILIGAGLGYMVLGGGGSSSSSSGSGGSSTSTASSSSSSSSTTTRAQQIIAALAGLANAGVEAYNSLKDDKTQAA